MTTDQLFNQKLEEYAQTKRREHEEALQRMHEEQEKRIQLNSRLSLETKELLLIANNVLKDMISPGKDNEHFLTYLENLFQNRGLLWEIDSQIVGKNIDVEICGVTGWREVTTITRDLTVLIMKEAGPESDEDSPMRNSCAICLVEDSRKIELRALSCTHWSSPLRTEFEECNILEDEGIRETLRSFKDPASIVEILVNTFGVRK
jgi:hypothetical protein